MSEDLIKRSDAIRVTWQEPIYTDPLNVLTEVRDRIEAIPSADRPQGEWIEMYRNGFGNMICMCSKCNFHASRSRYCPNCGASMREREGE